MRFITPIIVYLAFLGLIGFSLWFIGEWWVLLFLIFMPEYSSKDND